MACDIHVHTEKRVIINDKKKWVNTDWFRQNEYRGFDDEPAFEMVRPYTGRNYYLFGILAGVRATVPDTISLGPTKGLPDDCDELTRRQFNDRDFHTPTWFTLKELQDYRKRMKKKKNVKEFEDYLEKINADYIWNEELENIKQSLLYPGFKWFLKDIEKKAIVDLKLFYYKEEPILLKQKLKEAAPNYRIIIWFDN